MERYVGSPLAADAKIALASNDALGNYAICTLLARAIQYYYPNCRIDFYGGERTRELEEASVGALFAYRQSLHGIDLERAMGDAIRRRDEVSGYDLVINIEQGESNMRIAGELGRDGFVCGPCIDPDTGAAVAFADDDRGDLWRDQEWRSPYLAKKFSFLITGFIGEIFVRLCYLEPISGAPWRGGLPRYWFPTRRPRGDTPDVLVSTGASLPEKLWPAGKWREVLSWLRGLGFSIGLLGAPRKTQERYYHSNEAEDALVKEGLLLDLRGTLTLPEVVGAIEKSVLVVTIDNGILHFAAAFDKPTVGLYRRDYVGLWAPPNPNLRALTSESGEVEAITVDSVRQAVSDALSRSKESKQLRI